MGCKPVHSVRSGKCNQWYLGQAAWRNASARFHISRLEALKLQTQQSIEVMFGNQSWQKYWSTMRNVYKSGHYHTAYGEICEGCGCWFGTSSALDDKQISKVINKPWAVDGKISVKGYGQPSEVGQWTEQHLTQNIILGKDPQKAIDEIARKMNIFQDQRRAVGNDRRSLLSVPQHKRTASLNWMLNSLKLWQHWIPILRMLMPGYGWQDTSPMSEARLVVTAPPPFTFIAVQPQYHIWWWIWCRWWTPRTGWRNRQDLLCTGQYDLEKNGKRHFVNMGSQAYKQSTVLMQ